MVFWLLVAKHKHRYACYRSLTAIIVYILTFALKPTYKLTFQVILVVRILHKRDVYTSNILAGRFLVYTNAGFPRKKSEAHSEEEEHSKTCA